MKHLAIILSALTLTACGTFPVLIGPTTNPVTPKIAFELRGTMQEIAVAAGAYAKLRRCTKFPAPCSSQTVVNQLRVYVNAGEDATKRLDDWALNHKSLNASALYQAALAAVTAAENYRLAQGVK